MQRKESTKKEKSKLLLKKKTKLEDTDMKPECHSQRIWDCSLHSKEDVEAIWLKKQEAIIKRQRMKQYSFSHRERKFCHVGVESVPHMEFRGESCRTLGQWLDREKCNGDVFYKTAIPSNLIAREWYDTTQVAEKNVKIEEHLQEDELSTVTSQLSFPRRSYSWVKKISVADESSMQSSPVFPTFMGVTERVRAKARSMSTPRQRAGFLDLCSDQTDCKSDGRTFRSSCHEASTSANEENEISQQRCQGVKYRLYR